MSGMSVEDRKRKAVRGKVLGHIRYLRSRYATRYACHAQARASSGSSFAEVQP
jgi:hypothetical protein